MSKILKFAAAAMFAVISTVVFADVKLPAIISDNMVLQSDTKVKIWGKADPGEKIKVSFSGQEKEAAADKDGKWNVELDSIKTSSESKILAVSGKNKIEVKNVLVGEVWLGSGQSNMEMIVGNSMNPEAEAKAADYPLIRYFTVTKAISSGPQEDVQGKWVLCSPDTVKGFSAVLYFFGRELHKKYKLPVGLINSSWGGTPIQAWTPKKALEGNTDISKPLAFDADKYTDIKTYNEFRTKTIESVACKDAGNKGEAEGWAKPGTDIKDWKEVKMPQALEKALDKSIDGAAWIRRDINIDPEKAGTELTIIVDRIFDAVTVYFNGEKISSSERSLDTRKVNMKVPGNLVKAGRNVIAIRFFNSIGAGGATNEDQKIMRMIFSGEKEGTTIAGKWFCRVEQEYPAGKMPFWMPRPCDLPSALYNAMIAPIDAYAIRGTLWYQGEANTKDLPRNYDKAMGLLIGHWRAAHANPLMPFYFVQLANYMPGKAEPTENSWADLRDSQRRTLSVPNTAMAVTIDIGDVNDIHPKNKQEVGRRLSLAARNMCFGEKDLEYSGPMIDSMTVKGDKAVLKFTHAKGLTAKGGDRLKGFAVSGADGKYVWADAKIAGDMVIISNDKVKEPVAVRYGWDSSPDCNLFNGDGLPASPFQAGK
ncbi:MAG TPA: 9-O-acetylesterase [Lentisphaeria bacterium]|nr:MAG: hypothetical protein A2X48_01965 [Lentisphaerae bacterium GWF2_49_21]HBC88523.1 9-O-acetylesterase [Lentisphaeria bacterium]